MTSTNLYNSKNRSLIRHPSISLISHELRSPIASILSVAHILNDSKDLNNKEAKDFIKDIIFLANDSLQLINDLLKINYVSEYKNLNLKKCNVSDLIKRSVRVVKGLALKNSIQIEIIIEEEVSELECDIVKMKQILVNLLTNALKYSPKDSVVKIGAKQLNQKLLITIKDQGLGMNEDELKNIYQIHQSRKENNAYDSLDKDIDSYGIGLNLVKKIVDLHQGKIEFISEGINKGLEVRIICRKSKL